MVIQKWELVGFRTVFRHIHSRQGVMFEIPFDRTSKVYTYTHPCHGGEHEVTAFSI